MSLPLPCNRHTCWLQSAAGIGWVGRNSTRRSLVAAVWPERRRGHYCLIQGSAAATGALTTSSEAPAASDLQHRRANDDTAGVAISEPLLVKLAVVGRCRGNGCPALQLRSCPVGCAGFGSPCPWPVAAVGHPLVLGCGLVGSSHATILWSCACHTFPSPRPKAVGASADHGGGCLVSGGGGPGRTAGGETPRLADRPASSGSVYRLGHSMHGRGRADQRPRYPDV
jgi:hypothetical protein